eukprot:36762-Eustigmatos_ZCMA.PRE.1
MSAPVSALSEKAKAKTEAYLPAIDAQRSKTLSSTDLEGAVPYVKKYVGERPLFMLPLPRCSWVYSSCRARQA